MGRLPHKSTAKIIDPTKPKKRGPKPIEFDISELEQIKQMAGYGLKNEQIANILGISLDTFRNKPDILQAINKGRDEAHKEVQNVAYKMATGDNAIPDMVKFWLRCRCGWTEKSQIDLTVKKPTVTIKRADGTEYHLTMNEQGEVEE